MKTIKFMAAALGIILISGLSASAQKIGSVNVDALVYNLPEIQSIQQQMEKFQQDSIGGEYTRLATEFQGKDSIYRDPKTSASVKSAMEKDYFQLQNTLQNWREIAGQAVQAKQGQLLQPLYKKVGDAINAVVKEKGYTYVLTQDAFVIPPPEADNLSIPVAQRLGIKVNQGNAPAGNAPAGNAPAGTTKPPVKK